jgi:hypothetical protein
LSPLESRKVKFWKTAEGGEKSISPFQLLQLEGSEGRNGAKKGEERGNFLPKRGKREGRELEKGSF